MSDWETIGNSKSEDSGWETISPKKEEQDIIGDRLIEIGKQGLGTVTGGILGAADFVYGGLKAIPQTVVGAGAILGGEKASDVEKFALPELGRITEEIAPSLGHIAEKFGVPQEFATKSPGYKWTHDEPMAAIGQLLQLPGEGVKALGGPDELASGINVAVLTGLSLAPVAHGLAPKVPVNPLTTKVGFPFNKYELPNNFKTTESPVSAREQLVVDSLGKELDKLKEEQRLPGEENLSLGETLSDKTLSGVDKVMERRQKGVVAPQYDLQKEGVIEQGTFSKDGNYVNPKLSEMVKEDTGAPYTRDLKAEEYKKNNQVEQVFSEREAAAPKLNEDVWSKFDEERASRAAPLEPEQSSPTVEKMLGLGIKNRKTRNQSGALDISVFKEGFDDFNQALSHLTDKLRPYFSGSTILRNSDDSPAVFLHGTRRDMIRRATGDQKAETFDPRNIRPMGDLGVHLSSSATSAHIRLDSSLANIGSTFEGFKKQPGWEKTSGSDYYGRDMGSISKPPMSYKEGGHIFPFIVETSPGRVRKVSKDINNWASPRDVIFQLIKDGILPENAYKTETGYFREPSISTLRADLIRKGIDALEYPNQYEAIASASGTPNSIIVLNTSKLRPLVDAVQKHSPMGGVGKKQGGAVGFDFKKEQQPSRVTAEELQNKFKEMSGGKELPLERAIALSNEINSKVESVGQKVNQKPNSLEKKLNHSFTNRETLTPQEAKLALEQGMVKDVDSNVVKKAYNSINRGITSSYGIRAFYDHPIVEAVMRPLSRAADSAKYTADHILHGKEGVVTKWRVLTKAEYDGLWDKMAKYEGVPGAEKNILDGLSVAQKTAYETLRKAQEADLARKNEARALEGKKPLTARANYLAGSWRGDRVFQVLDKDGKLVGVVTGSSKELQVAKDWLVKEHPDYQMTPEVSAIKTDKFAVKDNLAELYDLILESNKRGEVSIQEGVLKAMADARIASSEKVRGVNLHEKQKKETPVFGAEGFKPWKSASENAQEGFTAQVSHLEGSILRSELSKAAKNIEDFKKELGNLNAIKIAENKLADMQGLKDFYGIEMVERKIAAAISDSGTFGQTVLKGWRKFTPAVTAGMNVSYFSVNVQHALLNLFETVSKTPIGILHGMEQAHGIMKLAAPWGVIKTGEHMTQLIASKYLKIPGAKMSKDAQFFHDYAMKQNVGNPTVEISEALSPHTTTSKVLDFAKATANVTITSPEIVSRYTAFTTMAHTFKAMGLEKTHAADLAHDLVKWYFKDYSQVEMASVFSRLGTIGRTGRQMRTWLLGEVNIYTSMIANGNVGLLGTMAGITALIYGLDSVPMFKEVDELLNSARTFAIKKSKDPKLAQAISELLTPREYLYSNVTKDPRGLLDKSLEKVGISGSSLGSSEWRLLPESFLEGFLPAKYVADTATSLYQGAKELTKTDPNIPAAVHSLVSPITPKIVGRQIEAHYLKDKDGNILNPKNEFSPTKTIADKQEERAYKAFGMQPKTTALSRYKEGMEFRMMEAIKEVRQNAKDSLKEAYNNLQLDPSATDRYDSAVKDFVKSYSGSDITAQAMQNVLIETAKELKFDKIQLKKIEEIKNAKNNIELVKFFRDVTGRPTPRSKYE